jgi:hypothetical protein
MRRWHTTEHENGAPERDTGGETKQQVGGRRPRPHGPYGRLRGVGSRRTTEESFEQ